MFRRTNGDPALVVSNNVFLHLHPVRLPARRIHFWETMCLGGLSFALFVVLTVTGFLLMFYYHPSVPQAYQDMLDLEHVVSSGVFLRNLHRWAGHAMLIAVFLHMVRVFYAGAYRSPREFNWVVGVSLLVFTILLSYTGYLLPWDQLSFWAITVGTNMLHSAPVLGPKSKFMLLGANDIGDSALLRFYVLHCIFLPLLAAVLMAVHFWRVRKDGQIRPL